MGGFIEYRDPEMDTGVEQYWRDMITVDDLLADDWEIAE